MKLYWNSYWVYTVKDFNGYLFSLYYCCFTCLRLAKSKKQLKVCPNDINTEWAIPEKFSVFLLSYWKFHIFNPPPPAPFPLCLFFFHHSVCIIVFSFSAIVFVFFHYSVSDCNHYFDMSTFTHAVWQEYIVAIENTYLSGVFLKSNISIFP